MTGDLTVYRKMPDPMAAAEKLGKWIHQSGKMFGAENSAQANVLAMHCLVEGRSLLDIARRNHIIQGKLGMRADTMLADFRALGGDHEIVCRTSEKAEVKLTGPKKGSKRPKTYTFFYTWEEAQEEPYVWTTEKDPKTKKPILDDKGEPKKVISSNYNTPRKRMQMLWARVISDGIRAVCPEVVAGEYAPEDLGSPPDETVVDVQAEEIDEVAEEPTEDVEDAEVVEQEPEQESADPPKQTHAPPPHSKPLFGTAVQRDRIRELFGVLNLSDAARDKILAKREVKSLHDLSQPQADELIKSLETAIEQARAKKAMEGNGAKVDKPKQRTDSKADDSLVDEIKKIMAGNTPLIKRMMSHLKSHGKKKLIDLSQEQAMKLKSALINETMEHYFAASLDDTVPF